MSSEHVRTRTRDTLIVDEVRETPVDVRLLRNQRIFQWVALVILIGFIVAVWD